MKERLARLRERRPLLDHLLRMQEHYSAVKGGQQAGAITYFGFLSFFPIMALAFFAVGWVANVFPDAQDALLDAIETVLPGIVGGGANEIALADIQDAAGAVGVIGLVGVLYSGLGWLSAMRDALFVVFEEPAYAQPSFVIGKLRDLVTLALVGLVLVLSVGVSGGVTGFSAELLDLVGLDSELGWVLTVLGALVGLIASTVLFYAMFRLLGDPDDLPSRSLWSGALFGAIGFEVLKQLSSVLLSLTEGQPAFQAFGIALILLVWINYFSRVVLYAASWAYTTREARALRTEGPARVQGPKVPSLEPLLEGDVPPKKEWVGPFAGGAAAMLALIALVRRRKP